MTRKWATGSPTRAWDVSEDEEPFAAPSGAAIAIRRAQELQRVIGNHGLQQMLGEAQPDGGGVETKNEPTEDEIPEILGEAFGREPSPEELAAFWKEYLADDDRDSHDESDSDDDSHAPLDARGSSGVPLESPPREPEIPLPRSAADLLRAYFPEPEPDGDLFGPGSDQDAFELELDDAFEVEPEGDEDGAALIEDVPSAARRLHLLDLSRAVLAALSAESRQQKVRKEQGKKIDAARKARDRGVSYSAWRALADPNSRLLSALSVGARRAIELRAGVLGSERFERALARTQARAAAAKAELPSTLRHRPGAEIAGGARARLDELHRRKKALRRVIAREQAIQHTTDSYRRILRSYRGLMRPGTSYDVDASGSLGFDALQAILTAAAHGAPVPTSLLASAGVNLTLGVQGNVATGDDTKVRASLTFTLTGRLGADLTFGSASADVSGSLSFGGTYEGLEHFAAHYLEELSLLVWSVSTRKLISGQRKLESARTDDAERWLRQHASEQGMIRDPGDAEGGSEAYRTLRTLQARPPGRTVTGSLDGAASMDAGAGLLAAGVTGSAAGTLSFRSIARDAFAAQNPGRRPKSVLVKEGTTLSASVSGTVGPFSASLAFSRVGGDANPDNDGYYLTLTLGGAGALVASIANPAIAGTLTEAINQTSFAGAVLENLDPMSLLGGTINPVLSAAIPVGSVDLDLGVGGGVTYVWFRPLERGALHTHYYLLYVRRTATVGGGLGVSQIPIYGGMTAGGYAGGSKTVVVGESIGTNTLGYVQTLYLGMRARPTFRAEWDTWVAKNRRALGRLFTNMGTQGTNAHREAVALDEDTQGGIPLAGEDFWSVLAGLERAFEVEYARRTSLAQRQLREYGWRRA